MVNLPYESLLGISYGLAAGFVPALVLGLVTTGIGLVRERSVHVAAGLVAAPIAVATVAGAGVLGSGSTLAQAYRLAMISTVAALLGVVAASQGNRIATELPQDRTFSIARGQALSADAIDAVDAVGQVTIRPTGVIREFDGYPPLSPALQTSLEEGAWRFPADLQLAELERRLERRLRTEHGLSLVEVSIDGRGRATIAAAPPAKGVATTLDDGVRAVTVTGLLPTGLESGDSVVISDGETRVEGDVLAIRGEDDVRHDGFEDTEATTATAVAERQRAATGTDGGRRRMTVAVETTAAGTLLEATHYRIAVHPNGDNHEFEAATLLEDAGRPVTALEGTEGETLDPDATLAVRTAEDWQFPVDGSVPDGTDRAFVAETIDPGEVRSDD